MTDFDSDEAVPEQSEQLDLQPEEMLIDNGKDDILDGGYEVPDHWSAAEGFGNTATEQAEGETLDQRLAQEVPDVWEDPRPDRGSAEAGVGSDVTSVDLPGQEDLDNTVDDEHSSIAGGGLEAVLIDDLDDVGDSEELGGGNEGGLFPGTEHIDDGEVGDEQVVRLVDPNEGTGLDEESELLGLDADDSEEQSAEEAAIHVVPGT